MTRNSVLNEWNASARRLSGCQRPLSGSAWKSSDASRRAGPVRVRWSDRVHEEWIAALLRNRSDLTPAQLARTRRLMDENVDDALVSGYEHIVGQLTLPDPNDCHVLAAAIHGGASVIVTVNLRDFPADALSTHGVEAQHPDTFIHARLDDRRTKSWLRCMRCGSTSRTRRSACASCSRASSGGVWPKRSPSCAG
jgi:hypothetical protein